MAPTESQKSRKVRERDKNPPPMAEHEDLDAQYLCFSDGKEGIAEILEYMKTSGADGDEGEEEEPAEVEFDFDKKEVLAAAELLERVLRFQPDFNAAFPLGDQLLGKQQVKNYLKKLHGFFLGQNFSSFGIEKHQKKRKTHRKSETFPEFSILEKFHLAKCPVLKARFSGRKLNLSPQ
ncbi:hypothetical protein B0H14DRAFT_2577676 [Mycena olivaceomarginata]|nr:hypothetical protein B0H14DRAFT_2577676 [Mycena olivaceomarginata]